LCQISASCLKISAVSFQNQPHSGDLFIEPAFGSLDQPRSGDLFIELAFRSLDKPRSGDLLFLFACYSGLS
jgi:hypothetical protein